MKAEITVKANRILHLIYFPFLQYGCGWRIKETIGFGTEALGNGKYSSCCECIPGSCELAVSSRMFYVFLLGLGFSLAVLMWIMQERLGFLPNMFMIYNAIEERTNYL